MNLEDKKSHKKGDIELRDILDIVRMHLGVVATITILAVVGTVMGHMLYLPVYDAYSTVEIKSENKASLADYMNIATPFKLGGAAENKAATKYLHYLRSSQFQIAVAQRLKYRKLQKNLVLQNPKAASLMSKEYWYEVFDVLSAEKGKKPVAQTDNLLISVEQLGQFVGSVTKFFTRGQSIEVRVRTLDAFTSMEIANTVATVFSDSTNEHDAQGLQNVENLLKKRLGETRDKLKQSELDLIDFRKKNRIAAVNQRGVAFSSRLNRIEEQTQSIRLKIDSNNNLMNFYEEQKRQIFDQSLTGKEETREGMQFGVLSDKLEKLREQKKLMVSSGMKPEHWRYKEVHKEISQIKAALKSSLSNGDYPSAGGTASIEDLNKKIELLRQETQREEKKLPALVKQASSIKSQLVDIPEAEQAQLMLKRRVDLEYATFSTLQQRLNEIEIQRISLDKKVQVDQLSGMPKPIRRLNLGLKIAFAFFVGLFFSVLMAFLLEYADNTIKSKSDLEDTGINFLGEIPCINGKKKKMDPKGPHQLVCLNEPSSLNSILFDFVRSRLESSRTRSGKDHVTITVTSSQANEGKSFIASNLAVSLARLGRKTVLVDCDLRCPSIHAYFDIANDVGLTDLFETDTDFDSILQKKEAPLPDIIPTGWAGGDPTVIFSSENFRIFMKHLRKEYDYVILDCPPVCVVPDAAILANISDSALLVSRYRSTSRRNLSEAQQKIHQISSKQVHGVINFKQETEKIISYYPYVMSSSNVEDPKGAVKNQKVEDFKKKFGNKKAS